MIERSHIAGFDEEKHHATDKEGNLGLTASHTHTGKLSQQQCLRV